MLLEVHLECHLSQSQCLRSTTALRGIVTGDREPHAPLSSPCMSCIWRSISEEASCSNFNTPFASLHSSSVKRFSLLALNHTSFACQSFSDSSAEMLYSSALAAFAALTITPLSSAAAIYSKSSPVLQIDGKDFDKLVKNSDKSSVPIEAHEFAAHLS